MGSNIKISSVSKGEAGAELYRGVGQGCPNLYTMFMYNVYKYYT